MWENTDQKNSQYRQFLRSVRSMMYFAIIPIPISRSQMFFKISILKSLAIFTGKHLYWCFPVQVFSCGYCEDFKKSFFYRTPPVAASEFGNNSDKHLSLQRLVHYGYLRPFCEPRRLPEEKRHFFGLV